MKLKGIKLLAVIGIAMACLVGCGVTRGSVTDKAKESAEGSLKSTVSVHISTPTQKLGKMFNDVAH